MLIVVPDPLTLYCDASRTLTDRFTVVAGAVASVQAGRILIAIGEKR